MAAAGFDATQGQSLGVVTPPSGREDLEPAAARKTLGGTVFLPCYCEMRSAAVRKLARLVADELASEEHNIGTCRDRQLLLASGAAV